MKPKDFPNSITEGFVQINNPTPPETKLLPCPACHILPVEKGDFVYCMTEKCLLEGRQFFKEHWNTRRMVTRTTPTNDQWAKDAAEELSRLICSGRTFMSGLMMAEHFEQIILKHLTK